MRVHAVRSGGHRAFVFLSFVAVAGIGGQFLLAGVAVFGISDSWGAHAGVGGALGMIVVVMAALCMLAPSVRAFRPLVFALFATYAVQVLLVAAAQSGTLPALGALHPLNGVVMAFIAVGIVRKAW